MYVCIHVFMSLCVFVYGCISMCAYVSMCMSVHIHKALGGWHHCWPNQLRVSASEQSKHGIYTLQTPRWVPVKGWGVWLLCPRVHTEKSVGPSSIHQHSMLCSGYLKSIVWRGKFKDELLVIIAGAVSKSQNLPLIRLSKREACWKDIICFHGNHRQSCSWAPGSA